MHPRRSARSGMALIVALAAVVLAGGMALCMQARSAAIARAERAEAEIELARSAAAEAAREAIWLLAADEDLETDHLGEEWAKPRETNREDGLSTWAMAEDAGRFFNWNNLAVSNRAARSQREILADLMIFCGDFAPAGRVDAMADYVDADDDGDYEAERYREEGAGHAPANRILWAPVELTRARGFSAGDFRPRPKKSTDDVFGGDLSAATAVVPVRLEEPLPINVNTAAREALLGVTGIDHDAAVRTVMALREVKPFRSLGALALANPEWAARIEGSVGTSSSIYRVRARASLGGRHRTVLAWVRRDSAGDVRIVQWVEGGG